ncbi:MAG: glycosyltransferase family 9 protein, partial [Omnitrophica bacterium]|nr:glycosyltransferase family 9 protein [Candidatus Omnitrophota bacterium]
SSRWQSKNWPFKNLIKLIELIYKNLPGFEVILFGDKDSSEYGAKIQGSLSPHPFNLCGKTTLKNLPEALKRLKIFITPDTATLHLSCALGIPTIGLFGPTDPYRHTVKSSDLHIFCEKLPCSFCYRPNCALEDDNFCLVKITPGQVFSRIREILKK